MKRRLAESLGRSSGISRSYLKRVTCVKVTTASDMIPTEHHYVFQTLWRLLII